MGKNSTKKIAEAILGESLQEPLKQIQRNAGIKNQRVYNEKNIGLDVKNDKEGDLSSDGDNRPYEGNQASTSKRSECSGDNFIYQCDCNDG